MFKITLATALLIGVNALQSNHHKDDPRFAFNGNQVADTKVTVTIEEFEEVKGFW